LNQQSKSFSILVVDDEEDLCSVFSDFVKGIGMDANSFTNPLLAFEHFESNINRYSLIIIDFNMPGMSGLELAIKIKDLNHSVKIFLITALEIVDIESDPLYQLARIDKLLEKTLDYSSLKQLIEEALLRKP
jgi:CheY-like chemotaxis protein